MQKDNKKILIIDDEENWAFLIERAILHGHKEKVDIIKMNDVQDALRYLSDNTFPDLLIVDLGMPGLDGFDLIEELRTEHNGWLVPVVVMSTHNDKPSILRSYAIGANSFVGKPNNYSDLVAICQDIMEYWFQTATTPSDAE